MATRTSEQAQQVNPLGVMIAQTISSFGAYNAQTETDIGSEHAIIWRDIPSQHVPLKKVSTKKADRGMLMNADNAARCS